MERKKNLDVSMNPIYLDYAASTPLAPEVLEKMMPYFCEQIGNPSSTHAMGRNLRTALIQARRTIANCLHANPAEIYFTSGGTEADNTALLGAVDQYQLTHVVSSPIEHHAITHTLEHLHRSKGVTITWLKPDHQGRIHPEELEEALKDAPRSLVSLMHGNNEIGTLNDLDALGQVCKKYNALFHSDTVQTMGSVAFDLNPPPIDFLAASAHKFYGPKGVGFLFMRNGLTVPSLIHGGGQERNLRAGTENVPYIIGMAHALKMCYDSLESFQQHLWDLKLYMMDRLKQTLPGVSFNGDTTPGKSLGKVLNVSFSAPEDAMLTFQLDIAGICTSGGSACNSGAATGSHVLSGIGVDSLRATNSVRFSFGKQTTKAEIDTTIQHLTQLLVGVK